MPVVPFSPQSPQGRAPRPISADEEPWLLMAAAQMDGEGRLIEKAETDLTKAKETTDGQ